MTNELNKHGGEVTLLDVMGDDLTVVNAARVSFSKVSTSMTDKDAKLINYLAKHKHWTPFAHPQVQLRIKAPIFVARQLFKHGVGCVRNEVSRRYVDETPKFWSLGELRSRPTNGMKQGSGAEIIQNPGLAPTSVSSAALEMYEDMIDAGVCPEQARAVLPQSMLTEWVETGSLYFYANLCKLRLDEHSQKETRMFAEEINNLLQGLFPVSWAALTEGGSHE